MKKILLFSTVFLLLEAGAMAQDKIAIKKQALLNSKKAAISKKTESDQDARIAEKQKYIEAQNSKKPKVASAVLRDERAN